MSNKLVGLNSEARIFDKKKKFLHLWPILPQTQLLPLLEETIIISDLKENLFHVKFES